MALRHIEGFENYGPANTTGTTLQSALRRRYFCDTTAGVDAKIVDGWGSGLALQWLADSDSMYTIITPDDNEFQYFVIGIAVKLSDQFTHTGSSGSALCMICTSASTLVSHVAVYTRLSGHLVVTGGSSGNILATSSKALKIDEWAYVELKVRIHDTLGSVDLSINGDSVATYTGDTRNSATEYGYKIVLQSVDGLTVDDLYIATNNDGSDDFLGPVKVETLRPTSDGDLTEWSPSANAAHYTLVDETPNSDSDYVSGAASGDVELFGYPSTSLVSIDAVQIGSNLAANAAGVTSVKHKYQAVDANTYNGVEIRVIDTTSVETNEIFPTDPNTGNAWEISDFNASQFGVERL